MRNNSMRSELRRYTKCKFIAPFFLFFISTLVGCTPILPPAATSDEKEDSVGFKGSIDDYEYDTTIVVKPDAGRDMTREDSIMFGLI